MGFERGRVGSQPGDHTTGLSARLRNNISVEQQAMLLARKVVSHFDALDLPKGSAIAMDMPMTMNVNSVGIRNCYRHFYEIMLC